MVLRLSCTKPSMCHTRVHTSHYNDVTMDAIASQITSLAIVYSTVYSSGDQRKHQSSASLAFVWGIHRGRGKCFHLMTSSCTDGPTATKRGLCYRLEPRANHPSTRARTAPNLGKEVRQIVFIALWMVSRIAGLFHQSLKKTLHEFLNPSSGGS